MAYLVSHYQLEDATIKLRADFVGSESIDSYEELEVAEVSDESVLISISIGYRVCLSVHLVRGSEGVTNPLLWPPRESYGSILNCAKEVFCRVVRDRVVELMSRQDKEYVASFFLDEKGKIESVSAGAAGFCQRHFPASKRGDDYFPLSHWTYIQGALRRCQEQGKTAFRSDSIIFSFYQESGIVNCLLQKMGGSGFLISLSLESQVVAE